MLVNGKQVSSWRDLVAKNMLLCRTGEPRSQHSHQAATTACNSSSRTSGALFWATASTSTHVHKSITKNKINLYNNKTNQTGQHQWYLKHTSFYIWQMFMYTINFIKSYNFNFAVFGIVLRALCKLANILPLSSVPSCREKI